MTRYQKLPLWFRNGLEILAICIGLFFTVILWQMGADGSVPALVLSIIISVSVIGIEPYKHWKYRCQLHKQYQSRVQQINQLLAGRSQDSILQASPYRFSRWPDGDDCYVIGDDRTGKIICSVIGASEAELWILEKTLAEELECSDP